MTTPTTQFQPTQPFKTKKWLVTLLTILYRRLSSRMRHQLCVPEVRTSRLYLLPKIHKPDIPGRPIVSACSCPTTHISAYLDGIFSLINKSLPSYVKDTHHALKIFGDFTFRGGSTKLLYTMDIQSLYTSIPHEDGMLALKFFLERRAYPSPPTHTLLRLAELVLTLNHFEFNGEYFHQVKGVAMGTKMGPSYACLFVGYLEHQVFQQYQGVVPDLYVRYIDDIAGAASCSEQELNDFIRFMSSFHPAIKYTYTITETQLPFLDISLSVTGNHISSSVHYKDTDSHCYLTYTSSHPPSTKDAIPYSQFLRLRRLCSSDTDFTRQVDTMADFFHRRDYPPSVVTAARSRVANVSRNESLEPSRRQNENRVPLVLTYHPHNTAVKNIMFKHWSILTNDDNTKHIFRDKPLCAFRRDKNLKDQLVSSITRDDSLPPGTFKCGRGRCGTCPFVYETDVLQGSSGDHRTLDHITCTTRNVIYAILCTSCSMVYVGQTSQRLGDRFVQHLRSITNRDGQPVARHFSSTDHPPHGGCLKICGLVECLGNTADRLNLETRLILKLGTLHPHGLNSRHDVRVH